MDDSADMTPRRPAGDDDCRPDDTIGAGHERPGDHLLATGIVVLSLLVVTATSSDYGMAWDEGFTVEREERLLEWFARVVSDRPASYRAWTPVLSKLDRRTSEVSSSPWSRASLRYYWQFAREEPNGHPPFYALLGLAGWAVTRHVLPPPDCYRFGPAVLFAVTLGVVYRVMARSHGRPAGLLAAFGLLAMPRVFAHAHLASYDVPTLCLWFLSAAAFLRATRDDLSPRGRWIATGLFSLALGCAMATKLTGWFIPVPLAVWAAFHRDLRALRVLVLGCLPALLVVYALNPTWWGEPLGGLRAFLSSNLTRQSLLPIPTLFLGRVYLFSLPWYNTLLITAITVPPVTLLLGLLGIGRVLTHRDDRTGSLVLICWAFLMVLRALPNAPGHDCERLFLPAFAFLSCLAGIGVSAVGAAVVRVASSRAVRPAMAGVVALTLGAGAFATWRFHPLQLSYYNAFIGGLSGATRAGMEPTYYLEAITPDVRAWLDDHTQPGDSVGFVFPAVTFEYLHRWGALRASPLMTPGTPPRWFVVVNRPGHLRLRGETVGQYLLEHGRPAFVKRLALAPDVPLVAIYPGDEALEAARLLRGRRSAGAAGLR